MSNSEQKLGIVKQIKPDGSPWIYVQLLKWARNGKVPQFAPSFHDLHRMIRALAECEDASYPPPRFKGRGRLADFLRDAVYEHDYRKLAAKYQIPERDGDRIVNTNGAAVQIGSNQRATTPPTPRKLEDEPLISFTADDITF